MIILGIILAFLGYYLLPTFLPEFPPAIDHLLYGGGVILAVVGVILLLLNVFTGRTVGGRRYWY